MISAFDAPTRHSFSGPCAESTLGKSVKKTTATLPRHFAERIWTTSALIAYSFERTLLDSRYAVYPNIPTCSVRALAARRKPSVEGISFNNQSQANCQKNAVRLRLTVKKIFHRSARALPLQTLPTYVTISDCHLLKFNGTMRVSIFPPKRRRVGLVQANNRLKNQYQ